MGDRRTWIHRRPAGPEAGLGPVGPSVNPWSNVVLIYFRAIVRPPTPHNTPASPPFFAEVTDPSAVHSVTVVASISRVSPNKGRNVFGTLLTVIIGQCHGHRSRGNGKGANAPTPPICLFSIQSERDAHLYVPSRRNTGWAKDRLIYNAREEVVG